LTSVTIPNSVTSIGFAAFWNCESLTSVTIPNSVTSIDGSAFSDCDKLLYIDVDSNNEFYKDIDGVLFNKVGDTIISYPAGKAKADSAYNIPDNVTSIGNYAFDGCSRLTSVTIPNSVTTIGNYAFDGCSRLTSVTIPNGVTSIGSYAFSGCSSLTNVTIPDSVTSIGNSAFDYYFDDLTIYGYSGSYAETYANENSIRFVALGNSDLSTVKKLVIDGAELTVFPDLTAYTSLEILSIINGNLFTNVTLPALSTLRFLSITEGTLKTIDLSKVPGLVELFLYSNQISDIDVSGLTNLKTLDIHDNNITNISSAADLVSLYYVDVESNFLNLSSTPVIASINKILTTTAQSGGELYYQTQGTPLVQPVLYGDSDKDGLIGTTDLLYTRRFIAGGYNFSESQFDEEAADVYYDGNIDLMDVLALRRYIADWYDALPITQ
jgi:Leucine-rich repeat (LRR) protein